MKDTKYILVADTNPSFYEGLKAEAKGQGLAFHLAGDAEEAENRIRTRAKGEGEPYLAILVSSNVLVHYGIKVIKFCLEHLPSIPLVMIEEMQTNLDQSMDWRKLGITRHLAKPFGVKEIQEIAGPRLQSVYEGGEIWQEKDLYLESDTSYLPIRIDFFIPGNKSLFDLYVKIGESKFIKLFRTGDKLEMERLSNYAHKELKHLYILKKDQEKYLKYCDIITKNIVHKNQVGMQQKFGHLFNHVEMTTQTLYNLGADNQSILYAQKNVKDVFGLVAENSEKDDFLKSLLKEVGQFGHSTSVLAVASVLAKHIGLESKKSVEILGVAALFHDIGMIREVDKNNPYDSVEESQRHLDEEVLLDRLSGKKIFGDEKSQLESIYRNHSQKGAEIISQMSWVPAVVPQIIRGHHAIENKMQGLNSGNIHPLSEIIEISDIFVHTIKRFQNQNVDRTYLLKTFLEITKRFPQRTRIPFQEAFQIAKS